MPSHRSITVGASLARLRNAIMLCCLAVGLSLATQLGVWSMLTFTDIRWTTEGAAADETPLIVGSDVMGGDGASDTPLDPAQAIRAVASTDTGERTVSVEDVEAARDARRTLGPYDSTLNFAVHCAKGVGTAGIIAMLPLMMLGVLVGAGAAARGCERLVGAFNLTIVLALLVMPLGGALSLPWDDGALTSYEHMTASVDAYLSGPVSAMGPFIFYARYLLLPGACLVGVVLAYLRLASGVEQAIIQGDALRVDPDIEDEASGVIVTAKGGRTANALNRLAEEEQARNRPVAAPVPPRPPRPAAPERPAVAPKPEMPRRII